MGAGSSQLGQQQVITRVFLEIGLIECEGILPQSLGRQCLYLSQDGCRVCIIQLNGFIEIEKGLFLEPKLQQCTAFQAQDLMVVRRDEEGFVAYFQGILRALEAGKIGGKVQERRSILGHFAPYRLEGFHGLLVPVHFFQGEAFVKKRFHAAGVSIEYRLEEIESLLVHTKTMIRKALLDKDRQVVTVNGECPLCLI